MSVIDPALAFALGTLCGVLGLLWPLWVQSRKRLEAQTALQLLTERAETLEADRAELGAHFTTLAHEVLHKSNDQFLQLAGERFKQWQLDEAAGHDKRTQTLTEMVKPVQRQLDVLQETVGKLSGVGGKLGEELTRLNKETGKLSSALRNPVQRGLMGEVLLQRLLDLSGLAKGVHYTTQESVRTDDGRIRPDVAIDLGGQMRIFIDAKAPMGEVIDHMDDVDRYEETAQKVALRVKEHIRALSRKEYWKTTDGPDFVVLFLPTDLLYSMAMQTSPDLLDEAADKRIILTSPMLLLALLRMLGLMARQVDATENAKAILASGMDLHHALRDLLDDWGKLGRQMDTATKTYNATLKSFERKVLPHCAKLEELHNIPAQDRLQTPEETKEPVNERKAS